jgi:hypothetical protein
LVDCGVHTQGDINTLGDIVANIAVETNQHLAVVIATHVHQDHISGFGRLADAWSRFTVDEVWLPWTEDPKDQQAITLQRKHMALAEYLKQHFDAPATSERTAARGAALEAVANLAGNQKAVQVLRSGFRGTAHVRYLKAGEALPDPGDIAGLTVRVLGPPKDPTFLARMDPPAGQRFLRMGDQGVEAVNALAPFAAKWRIDRDTEALGHLQLSPMEEQKLREALADTSLESLAFALDHARNNTSLVTLFIFQGQYLLFPGDAQYGNWQWWLEHEEAEDILSRVTFLKVAHHGSHNATPRGALEKMTAGFAAMVSTQSVPWESIPRLPLMQRLEALTNHRVVRSDSLAIARNPAAPKGPALPQVPAGFRAGDLWYDYVIRL